MENLNCPLESTNEISIFIAKSPAICINYVLKDKKKKEKEDEKLMR